MTGEKYLGCTECKGIVYASKNGKIDPREDEQHKLALFIEKHEYNCEGNIFVLDESII